MLLIHEFETKNRVLLCREIKSFFSDSIYSIEKQNLPDSNLNYTQIYRLYYDILFIVCNDTYVYNSIPIPLREKEDFCRQFFPDDYVGSAIDNTVCIVYCLTRNAIWAIDLD